MIEHTRERLRFVVEFRQEKNTFEIFNLYVQGAASELHPPVSNILQFNFDFKSPIREFCLQKISSSVSKDIFIGKGLLSLTVFICQLVILKYLKSDFIYSQLPYSLLIEYQRSPFSAKKGLVYKKDDVVMDDATEKQINRLKKFHELSISMYVS